MRIEIDTSSAQFQEFIQDQSMHPDTAAQLTPEAIDRYQAANPGTLEEAIAEAVAAAVVNTIL